MKRTICVVIDVGTGGSDRISPEMQAEELQYWQEMTLDVLKNVQHNLDKAARIAERHLDYQPVDFTTIGIDVDPSPGSACTLEGCGQTCDETDGVFILEVGDVSHGDYTEAVAKECDCEHHGRVR